MVALENKRKGRTQQLHGWEEPWLSCKKDGGVHVTTSWCFCAKIRDLKLQSMKTCSLSKIRAVVLLQQLGPPSLSSSYNNKKVLLFQKSFRPLWGGGAEGGCLGFCFLGVLGGFFFGMVPSLSPIGSDTLCFHCSSLYILDDLSKHVKNAHPLVVLSL